MRRLVFATAWLLFSSFPQAGNWPSFRGPSARGVSEELSLPDNWNGSTGENILWKVSIPGFAHSSPITWGDQVYVLTAISSQGEAYFKHGLFGAGDAADDRSVHEYKLYAFDKESGRKIWESLVHKGPPSEKRHVKASYADATPATDGQRIVVSLGSDGLHAFDMQGQRLWRFDLGRLDLGAYDVPSYEWGTSSSPLIYENLVIMQCDTQADDFIVAIDIASGQEVWRTPREEMPSWATPNVYRGPGGDELVTNAPNFIRGYDPRTGKELWRLGPSSNITAPTPVFSEDFIVVASGRRPVKPIVVLKPGARGDISLPEGRESGGFVAWQKHGAGPYMPTPLIDGDRLFVLNNDGIFDAYRLATGERLFRTRIRHAGGGFSASPVMADGKIYLSGEDGDIYIIRAADTFEQLASNPMGETLMATPALGEKSMFVRGRHHLFAIGK